MGIFSSKQPKNNGRRPAKKSPRGGNLIPGEDDAFITSVSKAVIPNDMVGNESAAINDALRSPKPKAEPERLSHPLMLDIPNEPDEAPRQRGWLPDRQKEQMAMQIQVADMLRKKVLAPDLPLDMPLERTEQLEEKAISAIAHLMEKGRITPPAGEAEQEEFFANILDEAFGFGPLEKLIYAEDVSEIMVNGPYVIFIEIAGRLHESGHKFLDDDHVERVIKRIVRPLGRLAD